MMTYKPAHIHLWDFGGDSGVYDSAAAGGDIGRLATGGVLNLLLLSSSFFSSGWSQRRWQRSRHPTRWFIGVHYVLYFAISPWEFLKKNQAFHS